MKKILLLAAVSATLAAVPVAAQAQVASGILIVDTDSIMQSCNACRAAQAQLQSQANSIQTRRNTLASQFTSEEQSIQAQAKALNGKTPGPALRAKQQDLQSRADQAQAQLQASVEALQSTQDHVRQQVGERLVQVVEQIRAQRRAAIVLSKGATLANDNSLDITGEALAALNQQLPSVSVTPLPEQQQTAPVQGGR